MSAPTSRASKSLENLDGRRWAARNRDVHGQDRGHRSDAGVTAGEDAAGARTVADGNNPLGFRCRPVGSFQSLAHVVGDRAGDEQDVRMARRRHEPQAETLNVVKWIVERMDLELAAIAGAGVDLADGEAAA